MSVRGIAWDTSDIRMKLDHIVLIRFNILLGSDRLKTGGLYE